LTTSLLIFTSISLENYLIIKTAYKLDSDWKVNTCKLRQFARVAWFITINKKRLMNQA